MPSVLGGKVQGGDVYSWGSGEMGQLGFRLLEDLPKDQDGYPYQPTARPIKAFEGIQVCQIAGGDGHTAAVTVHGKLHSWGASACGQLGHGDTESMPKDVEGYPYQAFPLLVKSLQDVVIVQIVCGDAHTIALSREGLLYSWGGGGCGQLGHSETSRMPKDEDGCPYQPTPRIVDHLRPHVVSAIACGKAHTIAVTDKGAMYTWGAGACGQLGHPNTNGLPSDEDGYPFQPIPREVESLRGHHVSDAACGDVRTLALTDTGEVYSFGGSQQGQLGVKDIGAMPLDADNCPYMPTPQKVVGLEGIVKLACGDTHSLAVDNGGRVYCWGGNSCGQLGIADPDDPRIRKDRDDNLPYLPTPVLLDALTMHKVVDVACGEAHSLAVVDTGDLYSWGACSCGQLGLGGCEGMPADSDGYPYQPVPTLVTAGLNGKPVLRVACGGVHNLAVAESDGSLAQSLAELVDCEALADVCFRLQGGRLFPAHLCILKVMAPLIYDFVQNQRRIGNFSSHMISADREVPVIAIDNTRHQVFASLMHFVYTDDAESCAAELSGLPSILELYHLGSRFQLGSLLPKCRRIIWRHLGERSIPVPRPVEGINCGAAVPQEEDPLPHPEETRPGGWGIFLLPAGQALVLDGGAYAEALNKGTLLDFADADTPYEEEKTMLIECMTVLLRDEASSDICLVVRNEEEELEYAAHKCILACRSAYFKALFSSEFMERDQSRLDLRDALTSEQLQQLLAFIYTDEWPRDDLHFATSMIPVADRFSVLDLKRFCERTLICFLSVHSAAQAFALADKYSCNRLRGRALLFITDPRNFDLVMKTEGFAELDKSLILEILHSHKATPPPLPQPGGSTSTMGKRVEAKPREHRQGRAVGTGSASSHALAGGARSLAAASAGPAGDVGAPEVPLAMESQAAADAPVVMGGHTG